MHMWASVVILCLVFAVVHTVTLDAYEHAFKKFINDFNKKYDDVSYTSRLEIFKDNLKYMEEYNSKNSHMQLGINDMSDLSHEEYLKLLQVPKQCVSSPTPRNNIISIEAIPTTIDWRNQSVVGPVSDIRPNSGPAYAVVGNVQSWCSIYSGHPVNYDPTQVVNCVQGGWNATEEQVFSYVEQNGLHSSWSSCNVSRNTQGCCANDHMCFGGSETLLSVAVGLMGPAIVTIDGSQRSFQSYQNGIYIEKECNSTNLNLNLLVVGYASNPQGQEYWIAQNFWGSSWGIGGYVLMPRNQNDTCGIAACPCHPVGIHQCVR